MEKLKTRTVFSDSKPEIPEYSKTRLEIDDPKSELLEAVEQLQKAKLLLPLRELKPYHGRAGDGKEWKVLDDFDNAGNATGNYNINKIPTLYTSDFNTSRDYAMARTNPGGTGEVHQITSNDEYASVIDYDYDFHSLSEGEYRQLLLSLRQTLPSPLEGSPVSFKDRDKIRDITLPRKDVVYTDEAIERYAQRNGISEGLAHQICEATNTRYLLSVAPSLYLEKLLRAFTNKRNRITLPDNRGHCHINLEYLATWLSRIHAVGIKQSAVSSTLGDRHITSYSMFDLTSINTGIENDKQRKSRNQRFGNLAMKLVSQQEVEMGRAPEPFIETIENPYSSPRELIEAAKSVPGYKAIFEADAGNWERFSLEEHTETTLRIFEHNYADRIPATLLPLTKLCLLVHDIGKPESAKRHDKKNQHYYNLREAERFMTTINLDDKLKGLVLGIIGEGKARLEECIFGGREYDKYSELEKYYSRLYEQYSGEKPTEEDVDAICSIAMMLQTCDSAAYTDAAVTRMTTGLEDIYYRNSPSFNESFKIGGTFHQKVKFNFKK